MPVHYVEQLLEQDALECCALPAIRGRRAFKVNDEDRRFQRIRKWSNLVATLSRIDRGEILSPGARIGARGHQRLPDGNDGPKCISEGLGNF